MVTTALPRRSRRCRPRHTLPRSFRVHYELHWLDEDCFSDLEGSASRHLPPQLWWAATRLTQECLQGAVPVQLPSHHMCTAAGSSGRCCRRSPTLAAVLRAPASRLWSQEVIRSESSHAQRLHDRRHRAAGATCSGGQRAVRPRGPTGSMPRGPAGARARRGAARRCSRRGECLHFLLGFVTHSLHVQQRWARGWWCTYRLDFEGLTLPQEDSLLSPCV